MMNHRKSDGISIQDSLLTAEIVEQARFADGGPGNWYFLNLGGVLLELGPDKTYAESLRFAIVRNAESFENKSTMVGD